MRVLVTGGTGRIGRYVVRDLVAAGHRVTNFGRSTGPGLGCRHLQGDLVDAGQIYQALRMAEAEAVVHMGAWSNTGLVAHTRTYGDNVQGTFNLFQACADLGVRRIVSASSAQVYGFERHAPDYIPVDEAHPLRPLNPYALAKVANERAADYFVVRHGLTILSFRIMGMRAPAELPAEIEEIARHPEGDLFLLWTRGDSRDCATACRLAIEVPEVEPGIYNVTGGLVLSRPLGDLAREYLGGRTEIRERIGSSASPLSCAKAEAAFGYRPAFRWTQGSSYPE
jgi:nucleoside-diphosphate-sugar epimerase